MPAGEEGEPAVAARGVGFAGIADDADEVCAQQLPESAPSTDVGWTPTRQP